MTSLSYDFHKKIQHLFDVRSGIDFDELKKLLERQMRYFEDKEKELERDIVNLKDRYQTTLKYERLNVISFEPIIESIHTLTERYLKRLENQPESPSSQLQVQQNICKN